MSDMYGEIAANERREMQVYQELFGAFGEDKDNAKAKAFDELAKLYFDKNFGNASKAEIDLLMFNIYCKQLPDDATDYDISTALAIPQQRVRNLRVKSNLRYCEQKYEWKNKFATLLKKSGKYDEKSGSISIPISDPVLSIEIENAVDKIGGFVEYKRNRKVLELQVEYFLQLAVDSITDKNERQEVLNRLKASADKDSIDADGEYAKIDWRKSGADLATIVSNISSVITTGKILFDALQSILPL